MNSAVMSMTDDDFITSVQQRMAARSMTQQALASACGLSQPHVSKVLNRQVKLRRKTRERLTVWMLRDGAVQAGSTDDELRLLLERLFAGPETRRMQIMQLLKIIEQLTRCADPA